LAAHAPTHQHTNTPTHQRTCKLLADLRDHSNNILQECAFSTGDVDIVACMTSFCSVYKPVVRVNTTHSRRARVTETNQTRTLTHWQRQQRDENGQDKLVCEEFCASSSTLLNDETSCHNATLCKLVNGPDADCLYAYIHIVCDALTAAC
jgi:hypothetical protein